MIRILALDTGTACGWATWEPKRETFTSGTQHFKLGRGESPGMRFLRFRRWLSEMLDLVKPKVIAYERSAHFKSAAAAEVCHGFQTIMHEEAACREIDTAPIQNSALKSHATGKGNCGKPAMVAAARKRWLIQLDDEEDDRADALCILAWALEECGVKPKKASEGTHRPRIKVKRITDPCLYPGCTRQKHSGAHKV